MVTNLDCNVVIAAIRIPVVECVVRRVYQIIYTAGIKPSLLNLNQIIYISVGSGLMVSHIKIFFLNYRIQRIRECEPVAGRSAHQFFALSRRIIRFRLSLYSMGHHV